MIEVTDDGTMDTVLRCSECGEEMRYTYASDPPDGESAETYEDFVEWAIQDATDTHDCYNPEREEED